MIVGCECIVCGGRECVCECSCECVVCGGGECV